MARQHAQKLALLVQLLAYGLWTSISTLRRALSIKIQLLAEQTHRRPTNSSEIKNVIVVGAAFAGYSAARTLANSLPRDGSYRVVVVEPNSHFNFTWVLPRFCVVEGESHKPFIPYTPTFFSQSPKGMVRWVRDRVASVQKGRVVLRSGHELPYEFLVIATGSTGVNGLPSRPGVEDREAGMQLLAQMQARIKTAARVVIAGGGAAGVELAADAKDKYPDKSITLVHSRQALMHRFGPGLQKGAMDALERLGVDVILGERADSQSADGKSLTLSSGRKIECDCFINCIGQKPASGLVAGAAPNAIAPTGHIRVKPTLEIDDNALPNVFVCGDVADTKVANPNSKSATRQAEIAAYNVAMAARGRKPVHTYQEVWVDEFINLTVGFERSLTHFWGGTSELLFRGRATDPDVMCKRAWAGLAGKPFEDTGVYSG
ncbi:apoptosis-inducing factor 2 [Staphylotrichum tortipilum]|uniref:Apoptosis-inducing factor 2 n=1 Tax=Staphylotrichum tortipilum TaxID=2831512 RepID=A0AAN6MBI4_9PEZI|nr:apoptosis-inducing factor 2 [Staphylotrichum longicolle]